MTRMVLETDYVEVMVKLPAADLDVYQMVEQVVRPLLLAAGYAEVCVDEALGLDFDGRSDPAVDTLSLTRDRSVSLDRVDTPSLSSSLNDEGVGADGCTTIRSKSLQQ